MNFCGALLAVFDANHGYRRWFFVSQLSHPNSREAKLPQPPRQACGQWWLPSDGVEREIEKHFIDSRAKSYPYCNREGQT